MRAGTSLRKKPKNRSQSLPQRVRKAIPLRTGRNSIRAWEFKFPASVRLYRNKEPYRILKELKKRKTILHLPKPCWPRRKD